MQNEKSVSRYIQIYERIKQNIVEGDYPFGSRIPSRKNMADEMHVSVITVKHAYELLCDEGYIEARERSGYYVVFREEDGFVSTIRSPHPEMSKKYIPVSSSFPFSVLTRTMRRVVNDYEQSILEKTSNKGSFEFREAIRKYLARNRNIHVDIERIVVGSGAEYLYSLLVGIFGSGTVYALEDPSYEKIQQVYHMAGAKCELLPLGSDGIESKALSETTAGVLHISPYRSYPSGVTASASKKYEYIRWASRENRFIIEDDFGSEFSISSKPEETDPYTRLC